MADPLKCDWVLIDSWWSQSTEQQWEFEVDKAALQTRVCLIREDCETYSHIQDNTIREGRARCCMWYSMMESHTIRDCSLGPIYFRITQRCRQPKIYYELRFYLDFTLHHTWKCNWNMTQIKQFVKISINSNNCVVTESNVWFLINKSPPQFLYRLFFLPWPPWSHK